jgi:50S ribosomal protein L16 3-hydroxylase
MLPADLSPENFLAEYWQKKPLIIKNAFANFQDPISPEELAGLACEEEVESRLVFNEKDNWRLKNGPFVEQDFTSLLNENWTLLVQAVDQWLPQTKKLLTEINFIPDWRLDDLMVSYATKNSGIGPHFDYYDVIIIQGQGQRHWQLGQNCNESSSLRNDSDLKILNDFSVSEEFTLECGDALYIPPGIAHQGTSLDDSLSYSIGFRAPSYAEIISQYAATIFDEFSEDERYNDPDLKTQVSSAEITEASIERMKTLLLDTLQDEQKIEQWFGQHMTQRKYLELGYIPDTVINLKDFVTALTNGLVLEKHPAARYAFYQNKDTTSLFVDGEVFEILKEDKTSNNLLSELCDKNTQAINGLSYITKQDSITLLCKLYNQGSLIEAEELEIKESK